MERWGHALRRGAGLAAVAGVFVAWAQPAAAQTPIGQLTEFREVVQRGDYAAKGTGLLGTGAGEIAIGEIPPGSTVTAAYLYWVIIAPEMGAQFDNGLFNGVPIDGEPIATGPDPCLDPDPFDGDDYESFVFRDDVTELVLPGGNGSYTLAGFSSGALDPTDPTMTVSQPPVSSGATLVILYENGLLEERVITVSDGAAVLDEDDPFQLATTTLRFRAIGAGRAKTTYAVAEGQFHFSDETQFNGVTLSRNEFTPGSFEGSDGPNNDSDTYDVTALVQPGDTSAEVAVGLGDDCIVHYVQLFSAPSGAEPEPALLVLTPPAEPVEVGAQATVTATVTTETGEPVENVLVRFDVGGGVETEGTCTTNADGQCTFTFQGPDVPGLVTVTAFADVDTDGIQDPGEPTGVTTVVFVAPPSTPLCEIKLTFGGWIVALNGDKGTFGGNAKADANRGTTGRAEYQDHGPLQPLNVHGEVTSVVCGPDRSGKIFGRGTVNGIGMFDFRIDVRDVAEPGTGMDMFRIRVLAYDSGLKVLMGGNVQVHG